MKVGSRVDVCLVVGVGSGALVGAPVSDTLVLTSAVVVVASVKMGGGTGMEVGGISVVEVMGGIEIGMVTGGEEIGEVEK